MIARHKWEKYWFGSNNIVLCPKFNPIVQRDFFRDWEVLPGDKLCPNSRFREQTQDVFLCVNLSKPQCSSAAEAQCPETQRKWKLASVADASAVWAELTKTNPSIIGDDGDAKLLVLPTDYPVGSCSPHLRARCIRLRLMRW